MRPRISIRGSVRPSVRRSVRPSVRPSVGHTRVENTRKCRFGPKLLSVRARTHLMAVYPALFSRKTLMTPYRCFTLQIFPSALGWVATKQPPDQPTYSFCEDRNADDKLWLMKKPSMAEDWWLIIFFSQKINFKPELSPGSKVKNMQEWSLDKMRSERISSTPS